MSMFGTDIFVAIALEFFISCAIVQIQFTFWHLKPATILEAGGENFGQVLLISCSWFRIKILTVDLVVSHRDFWILPKSNPSQMCFKELIHLSTSFPLEVSRKPLIVFQMGRLLYRIWRWPRNILGFRPNRESFAPALVSVDDSCTGSWNHQANFPLRTSHFLVMGTM